MDKPRLYCEIDFLETLCNRYLDFRLNEINGIEDSAPHIANLYSLVFGGSELIHNCIDYKHIEDKIRKNPYLKPIIKKGRQGEPSTEPFIELRRSNPLFFEEKCRDVFMVCLDDYLTEDTVSDYGVICLNDRNYIDESKKLLETVEKVIKREPIDIPWDFLKDIRNPINSMVIIDPYIFDDKDYNMINYNLFEILYNLLPESLADNFDFHLTILTKKIDNIRKAINNIQGFISRYPYSFKLGLIRNDDYETKLHDRYIITNNYFIDSRAGFKLFRKKEGRYKSDNFTRITGYPSTSKGSIFIIMNEIINYAKETYFKAKDEKNSRYVFIGDIDNRLFKTI